MRGDHGQEQPPEEQALEAGKDRKTEPPERNAALWTS